MFRSECWSSYQRWLAPVYDPLGDTLVKANSLGAAGARISGLLILLGIANFGFAQISEFILFRPDCHQARDIKIQALSWMSDHYARHNRESRKSESVN